MKTGILETEHAEAVFGLHSQPEVPTGQVVVHEGPLMAAKINFRILVHGRGGHGSMPRNASIRSSVLYGRFRQLAAGMSNPLEAIVLSVCSIHARTPDSLIVDEAVMTGSMRTFEPAVEARALEQCSASSTRRPMPTNAPRNLSSRKRCRPSSTRELMVSLAREAAKKVLGEDGVVDFAGSCHRRLLVLYAEGTGVLLLARFGNGRRGMHVVAQFPIPYQRQRAAVRGGAAGPVGDGISESASFVNPTNSTARSRGGPGF